MNNDFSLPIHATTTHATTVDHRLVVGPGSKAEQFPSAFSVVMDLSISCILGFGLNAAYYTTFRQRRGGFHGGLCHGQSVIGPHRDIAGAGLLTCGETIFPNREGRAPSRPQSGRVTRPS